MVAPHIFKIPRSKAKKKKRMLVCFTNTEFCRADTLILGLHYDARKKRERKKIVGILTNLRELHNFFLPKPSSPAGADLAITQASD